MLTPSESSRFYTADRAEWRRWLSDNYRTSAEVWLVFYKKGSGKPRLGYNDAVEEALSFGWIDSTAKTIDDERFAQRFTPRRAGSSYSQLNKERLRRLIEAGMVAPDVLESLRDMLDEPFEMPDDILDAIRSDEAAWEQFQSFSPAYQRIRIAFIDGARSRPEEYAKRLRNFIAKTAQGKKYGTDGVEKFY